MSCWSSQESWGSCIWRQDTIHKFILLLEFRWQTDPSDEILKVNIRHIQRFVQSEKYAIIKKRNINTIIHQYLRCSFWLEVKQPLWKIWLRQLGWWHSQLNGKSKMFQTINQITIIFLLLVYSLRKPLLTIAINRYIISL